MKNNSLLEIVNQIKESSHVIIFTHMLLDGDTSGSASSLCQAIRKLGKKCIVLPGESLPGYLSYLNHDCFYDNEYDGEIDLCISVDCSDLGRLEKRSEIYQKGKCTINIDHHKSNTYFGALNYVIDEASSTGELIYELLLKMEIELDVAICEGIYTAIVTDTGNFQYSNTTAKTHRIVADLIDYGVNINDISISLYQSVRAEKLQIMCEILTTMELFEDGKIAFAYVTQEMLSRIGATVDETDGIIEMLRGIYHVEVSVFAKELKPGIVKVGFRSKRYVDVAEIAGHYGGGGHARAAGCSIKGDMTSVRDLVAGIKI